MRQAYGAGASRVRSAALETLEDRKLMAAVTFDIDPNLSSITVSGSISALGATAAVSAQSTGSATAKIDGSIKTDLTSTSVKFLAGSVYDALPKTGPFLPGNVAAAFAVKGTLNLGFFSATANALVTNAKFDTVSNVLPFSGSSFAAGTVDGNITSGSLVYEAPGVVPVTTQSLVGGSAVNNGAGNGSVVTSASGITLTIPIKLTYNYALSVGTAVFTLTGTIVGKFATAPQPTGSISGAVYNDLNDNGARDSGEVGLSAVTVYLDKNNNNILDTGDVSKVTDGSGNYSFLNLPAGAYTVRQVVKPGFRQTSPAGGEYAVTVGTGAVLAKTFGNTQKAAIAGQKFNDLNDNGIKDAGELGLAGWTIYLDKNNNNVFDTGDISKVTDANGQFVFRNVTPGTYAVREVGKTGWRQTTPLANGGEFAVTLGNAQGITTLAFGNTQKTRISGTVFNDANDNGIKDTGELGLSGWQVYLDKNNNNVFDTGDVAKTTDASGNYLFTNLTAGAYTVRETVKTGFRQTSPSGAEYAFTSALGQVVTAKNFGNTQKVRISGIVFADQNNNRTKEAAELGIASVRVFLDANNDGIYQTTERSVVTGSTGAYSFTNLTAGTFRVRIVTPAGRTLTTPTGGVHSFTLVAGQVTTIKHFGLFTPLKA